VHLSSIKSERVHYCLEIRAVVYPQGQVNTDYLETWILCTLLTSGPAPVWNWLILVWLPRLGLA